MVSKALLVLGPVTLALGLWRSSPGLIVVGAVWLLSAFAGEWHRGRAQAEIDAAKLAAAEATGDGATGGSGKPAMSTATFLTGIGLLLVAGLPALLVGLSQWGIDEGDWRWLPLIVGAAITGLALLSALMYGVGSGAAAVAGEAPAKPARIVIVSMEQTGTYINEQPRIEFVFDVTPEGAATYRVTKRATVPFTGLGALRAGGGFEAMVVGPEDPANMEIDWNSPLSTPGVGTLSDRLRELEELRDQGLVTAAEYDAQRQRLLEEL